MNSTFNEVKPRELFLTLYHITDRHLIIPQVSSIKTDDNQMS